MEDHVIGTSLLQGSEPSEPGSPSHCWLPGISKTDDTRHALQRVNDVAVRAEIDKCIFGPILLRRIRNSA